ncbi:MAG: hypothetical protein OXM56_11165 [Gammaproteobacteria bacterium]|nr:hypothetical protein [Gammaproteobacteria bacterium]
MADAAFPGGEDQIAQEAAELTALLRERVSQAQARKLLVHAKGRLLIAFRSAGHAEAVRRCAESIRPRLPKELDQTVADEISSFAYRRLTGQQSRQTSATILADMNKEEAHLVARITAYRLARHFGRTEVQVQHVYDLDPRLYITRLAQHLLTHDAQGRSKRVETRPDAHDLCLDIASSLVLAHLVEDNDTDSAPDPTEVDRLARQELELTLSLLMADDFGSYANFDPSEVLFL